MVYGVDVCHPIKECLRPTSKLGWPRLTGFWASDGLHSLGVYMGMRVGELTRFTLLIYLGLVRAVCILSWE